MQPATPSTFTIFYPDCYKPVLVLHGAFLYGSARYILHGKRRYAGPPLLDFTVNNDGHRLDLTQSGTYGTDKTLGGLQ